MKIHGIIGGIIVSFFCATQAPLFADQIALSFKECLNLARENNRKQKISQADIYIAEQLLKQAQSSYWPSLSAGLLATRFDEDPVYTVPGGVIPNTGGLSIPDQQTKVMDRDNLLATVTASVPLYTGGYRGALTDQARQNIIAAKEAARRTDLEITRDIKRYYYGTVTAAQHLQLATDTIARMEGLEQLTERLYMTGGGTVKKTDYLRIKSVNSILRATKADLESRHAKSISALNYTLGCDHFMTIVPAENELPTAQAPVSVDQLMLDARNSNPDLARIRAGISAAEAEIRGARSGYHPKLGAFATYSHTENEYDKGIVDPINKDTGVVGLKLDIPLFNGFRTKSEVAGAKKNLEKLQLQEMELLDGIRLQLELTHIEWMKSHRQMQALADGLDSATANRDLNERAYRESLVETGEVIKAQLLESMLKLKHIQTRYDCIVNSGTINFLTGGPNHEK